MVAFEALKNECCWEIWKLGYDWELFSTGEQNSNTLINFPYA